MKLTKLIWLSYLFVKSTYHHIQTAVVQNISNLKLIWLSYLFLESKYSYCYVNYVKRQITMSALILRISLLGNLNILSLYESVLSQPPP